MQQGGRTSAAKDFVERCRGRRREGNAEQAQQEQQEQKSELWKNIKECEEQESTSKEFKMSMKSRKKGWKFIDEDKKVRKR